MSELDSYMEKQADADAQCSQCGATGAVEFWDDRGEAPNSEPDDALCGSCLLDSDGRFKNESPAELIREHESVERSYITKDNTLCIETSSFLGKFTHVFYLEDSLSLSGHSEGQQHQGSPVRAQKGKSLSGESEVFDSNGNYVHTPSAYTELAIEILQNH